MATEDEKPVMSGPTGRTLGKYQLLEEIGRGGMGAVYKAYDPSLDRTVAIKVLAPHLAWEKDSVERFLREARAAARLRHPNIVEIHDVGQDGSDYYFVMAYLPGPSLKNLISRQGRLAPPDALLILRPLADALDYAHSKGLVHRDVKPANVMFDERGQAILMDLGIAKAAQETRLTVTGIAVGTPHYMAPEQIEGRAVDGRTDGYALGIMAFEMLTGRVPFDADTTTAILYKQVHEPPPCVTTCCPDLAGAVEIALDRMLAKSPADRFDSCGEFVNALEQAMGLPASSAAALKPLVAPTPTLVYPTPTAPLPAEPPKVQAGPTVILPPPPPPALAAGWRRQLPWMAAGIAVLLLLALIACASVAILGGWLRRATPTPTAAPAAVPTSTSAPTQTLPPTDTPAPTSTPSPLPTDTRTPTSTPSPTPTPLPVKPVVRFWADKTEIFYGQCTTLHWQVEHVRAVLYQGNPAYGTGQDQECPMKTSTVRLTVIYLDGSRQDFPITITILQ